MGSPGNTNTRAARRTRLARCSWNSLLAAIETAGTFDDLIKSHETYLDNILYLGLLGEDKENKENNQLDFSDFFDLNAMASETEGFQVMEMKEFLEHEGGRLMPWGEDGPEGSTPTELPGGITDWSEVHKKKPLENYLRTVGLHRKFDTIKSMIIIPKDLDKSSPSDLAYLTDTMKEPVDWKTASKKYYDAPVSTRASALERFGEARSIVTDEVQEVL